jgi:hypothetical protein
MYTAFVKRLREVCAGLPDNRKGGNNQHYELQDGCLSAFGVFFTQSPSFLAYQREMRLHQGQDNAQSLFGVTEIPSDNQIRNLLDPIDPACLGELFWWTFKQLQAGGQLADFRGYAGQWLCALDGVQYFSSDTIHCDQCTRHQHGKKTRYSHSVIAPVLVAPGHDYVISLEPEFITPQDGADKQDSEAAAAHRWTARQCGRFAAWRVTILADDLHSHEPFCRALLQQHYNYILVCKPESHAFLYEQLGELAQLRLLGECVSQCWNGKGKGRHEAWTYRYANDLWLRDSDDALRVNWCELLVTNIDSQLDGRVGCAELLYHNTFITNHRLKDDNVAPIVRSGRARWKTENENHNTLKQQGYHLEHNFGHGEQHLAAFLLALNLLAFLLHTSLSLTDATYQSIRQALGRRTTFFDDIRTLTRYLYFDSWLSLITFMFTRLELGPPPDHLAQSELAR